MRALTSAHRPFPAQRPALLRQLLNNQDQLYSYEALVGQMTAMFDIQHDRKETLSQTATSLHSILSPALQKAADLTTLATRFLYLAYVLANQGAWFQSTQRCLC